MTLTFVPFFPYGDESSIRVTTMNEYNTSVMAWDGKMQHVGIVLKYHMLDRNDLGCAPNLKARRHLLRDRNFGILGQKGRAVIT
jgi:hypothetical protein